MGCKSSMQQVPPPENPHKTQKVGSISKPHSISQVTKPTNDGGMGSKNPEEEDFQGLPETLPLKSPFDRKMI